MAKTRLDKGEFTPPKTGFGSQLLGLPPLCHCVPDTNTTLLQREVNLLADLWPQGLRRLVQLFKR